MRGSGSTGASKGTVCTHSNDAKCNRAASMMIVNLPAGHAAARHPSVYVRVRLVSVFARLSLFVLAGVTPKVEYA